MLTSELQTFLSELIHITNRSSAESFKQAVMQQLNGLIPFDMALWAGGYVENLQLNNVFLYELPNSLMDSWEKIKHQDRLLAGLIANPGQTFDVYEFYSCRERNSLATYQQHSKLFGIENAISTALPDPGTGLLEIMSLYRRDPDQKFSKKEQLTKQFVFPIIKNAWYHNQIQQMALVSATSLVALCDNRGWLRIPDSRFISLLKDQWPSWSGPILPEPILFWLKNTEKQTLKRNNIFYCRKKVNDMTLVEANLKGNTDALTKREDQIAELFASGLTYKQIAEKLNLSPNTVRRHIESVYKKLKISNKMELQQTLNP